MSIYKSSRMHYFQKVVTKYYTEMEAKGLLGGYYVQQYRDGWWAYYYLGRQHRTGDAAIFHGTHPSMWYVHGVDPTDEYDKI